MGKWSLRGRDRGVSLIEAVIATAIFAMLAIATYEAFGMAMRVVQTTRTVIAMTALGNEQIEIIRNIPFEDVGIEFGVPLGVIPHTQNITRGGTEYEVTTTIRNIDDPFDGQIGSTTNNDLSPADYKLVEVEIDCPGCSTTLGPSSFTTLVAPQGLETSSTNGALFVEVLNASGLPVPGASIHIENNAESPPIVIDDVTSTEGLLQIVDTVPGVDAYAITASKAGYSTAQTYTPGAPTNPNPKKEHATVQLQTLTEITLFIDEESSMDFESIDSSCSGIGGVDFALSGGQLIGTSPDVYHHDSPHTTNGSGNLSLTGLEWGTYTLTFTDAAYDLAGTIPLFPLSLTPGSSENVQLVVTPSNPESLVVTVRDAATDLPLSNAEVVIESATYQATSTTGVGFVGQTDWSGPSGQTDFGDTTAYLSATNIETADPVGDIKLTHSAGVYDVSGTLTSSTFDTGGASMFERIEWLPLSQPVDTGVDSVRFQVASNNDNATWDFVGPDGTSGTYYTVSDQNLHPSHDGDRYMRIQAFLSTTDTAFTPTVSEVSVTYTSGCVPPGQVYFGGLTADTYDVTVTRGGYSPQTQVITVNPGWQEYLFGLSP